MYTEYLYRSDVLMHHGTKGMHWGIRRYQNKDGSLTAAGKQRRNHLFTKVDPNTHEIQDGIIKKAYGKVMDLGIKRYRKRYEIKMSKAKKALQPVLDLPYDTPEAKKAKDEAFKKFIQNTKIFSKRGNSPVMYTIVEESPDIKKLNEEVRSKRTEAYAKLRKKYRGTLSEANEKKFWREWDRQNAKISKYRSQKENEILQKLGFPENAYQKAWDAEVELWNSKPKKYFSKVQLRNKKAGLV